MTTGAPGQAALRLAVITEVREAASCESDDGDQCPKCTRHADAVLAAVAAQEPQPAPELAELREQLDATKTVLQETSRESSQRGEQARLAGEDRDQLRKHVLSLAAAWGDLAVKCDAAAALDGLAKAAALEQATLGRQLRECAAALRKAAGLPS